MPCRVRTCESLSCDVTGKKDKSEIREDWELDLHSCRMGGSEHPSGHGYSPRARSPATSGDAQHLCAMTGSEPDDGKHYRN